MVMFITIFYTTSGYDKKVHMKIKKNKYEKVTDKELYWYVFN